MSAAVNDRPHNVFSPHLPLTGELHPLRREFERWLLTGNAIAVTTAMLVFATVYFWPRTPVIDVPTVPRIIDPRVVSPPPGDPPKSGGEKYVFPPSEKARYEPVDEVPDTLPLPNERGGSGVGDPGEPFTPYYGPGDSIAIPSPPAPAKDFDWWTEAPVLLSIAAPDYPRMVRDAGIEGEVLVRVLIGLNGKVKDAFVVEGSSALREAALASARTAFFQPAKQGVRAVEVWVVIPIRFELSGHD